MVDCRRIKLLINQESELDSRKQNKVTYERVWKYIVTICANICRYMVNVIKGETFILIFVSCQTDCFGLSDVFFFVHSSIVRLRWNNGKL